MCNITCSQLLTHTHLVDQLGVDPASVCLALTLILCFHMPSNSAQVSSR